MVVAKDWPRPPALGEVCLDVAVRAEYSAAPADARAVPGAGWAPLPAPRAELICRFPAGLSRAADTVLRAPGGRPSRWVVRCGCAASR